MKVIKKSEKLAWTKRVKCSGNGNGGGGCGALLEITLFDLYSTTSYDYTGGSEYYTTFTCCECGIETDIEDPGLTLRGRKPSEAARKKLMDEFEKRNTK